MNIKKHLYITPKEKRAMATGVLLLFAQATMIGNPDAMLVYLCVLMFILASLTPVEM